MKVQIEKSFPLPADAQAAWRVLQDIEAVASCMPGAKITERVDDTHYKGTVGVRFGPAQMSFRGELEVRELDASARKLHLSGKGTDSSGSSGAALDLTARIEAVDAASCTLVGTSEVSVSGKAATFGGRMMNAVADQVLQKFIDNFAVRVAAGANPPSPAAQASSDASANASPALAPASDLNAFAILWGAFKTWLRTLFGKRLA